MNSASPLGTGSSRRHKPAKGACWSHQWDLRALRGQAIELVFAESAVTGLLIDADQFTVKVRLSAQEGEIVYFKSALRAFRRAAQAYSGT